MQFRSLGGFIVHIFWLILLLVVFFVASNWLKIPSGELIQWIIGVVIAWWLYVIVTIPWNVYFEAKAVVDEADLSRTSGIKIKEQQLLYVQKVRSRALFVSIALHVLSAAVLFLLAAFNIVSFGYFGAISSLLLTALRPSIRAYQYLWQRLSAIRLQVKYPREDVVELRTRTLQLEDQVRRLTGDLDINRHDSFAGQQLRASQEQRLRLEALESKCNQLFDDNKRAHEQILQEGHHAMAKISADSQFLNNVREIVKLIKSA